MIRSLSDCAPLWDKVTGQTVLFGGDFSCSLQLGREKDCALCRDAVYTACTQVHCMYTGRAAGCTLRLGGVSERAPCLGKVQQLGCAMPQN